MQRGFRRNEWRDTCDPGGNFWGQCWRYHGTRIVLQARNNFFRQPAAIRARLSVHGHGVFSRWLHRNLQPTIYCRVSSHGYFPTESELALNGAAQVAFHERAAAATRKEFGNEVFVRAVVEVSNFCRKTAPTAACAATIATSPVTAHSHEQLPNC